MSNPQLIKAYTAESAISKHTIVKFGGTDGSVLQATGGNDNTIGVSCELDVNAGGIIDVVRSGIAEVVYGGSVSRGDKLTSDASGRAVTAAPAAGVNMEIIGIAEVSGILGDIVGLYIAPGSMQG